MSVRHAYAVALTLLLAAPAFAADLTQADLLRRLIDLDRLVLPPEPRGEFFSSRLTQRAAGTDGDAPVYLREEDGWRVLAETSGPGAITRIWVNKPQGTLRLLLDGVAALEMPFRELFDGSRQPFGEPLTYTVGPEGGWSCYFPFGFNTSCKVLVKDATPHFEISIARFAPGTKVAPFAPGLDTNAAAALEEVSAALRTGLTDKQIFGGRSTRSEGEQRDLKKGETLQWPVEGHGVIRALYVALTDPRETYEPYTFHRLVIRIWFDGAQKPAVEAPLVDFFGSGFDFRGFDSLPLGTEKWLEMPGARIKESRFMFCFFPMPFSKGAIIEIENLNEQKIGLHLYLKVDRAAPPERSLRFHARFRSENPATVSDYRLLNVGGPGRIVGTLLNVDTPRSAWWGTGGAGALLGGGPPSRFQSVSAAAWFGDNEPLRAHLRPCHGATLAAPWGKNSAYRWFISDSIEFQNGAQFVWDQQPTAKPEAYVSSVAYWYGPLDAPHNFRPLKRADLDPPGLRIPDSVEVEGNVLDQAAATEIKQRHAGGVEFSGETAMLIKEATPVKMRIPWRADEEGMLYLRVQPRKPFETIRVSTDAGEIGTVKFEPRSNGIYQIGKLRLSKGDTVVTVECSKSAVLDCWIIQAAAAEAPKD